MGGPGGMMGGPGGMMGGPGGMMGGPGGMMGGPGGMMSRPGGMMGGPGMGPEGMMAYPGMGRGSPPPGYTSMPQRPLFPDGGGGSGPPNRNPYSSSTASSAGAREEPTTRRSSRRPNDHASIGLFAKDAKSPKLSRSRTAPTTAERINRTGKNVGPSGKEWISGDAFLDACTCTTNCTCRGGHRVLYRSRSDAGSDSDSAHCRTGEIRYILKKDLGKDCGDHSGCKARSDSDDEEKQSKKEKKKEEKKRKEEFDGFKEDMLEALDQRLDKLKAERSKASSARSSPRLPHAGMGPGGFARPGAIDPLRAQRMGGMNPGAMGMPPGGMGMTGAQPYPMGMANMPPGISNIPPDLRALRPGQMHYEDSMSVINMENLGLGNPYYGKPGAQGFQARYMSPGRRKGGGADFEAQFRRNLADRGNRRPQGPTRLRRGVGSDDVDFDDRRQQKGKRGSDGGGGGEFSWRQLLLCSSNILLGGIRDDDDPRGACSPGRHAGRKCEPDRGRQPHAESDDDYE
jgi:hypothetical protein